MRYLKIKYTLILLTEIGEEVGQMVQGFTLLLHDCWNMFCAFLGRTPFEHSSPVIYFINSIESYWPFNLVEASNTIQGLELGWNQWTRSGELRESSGTGRQDYVGQ